MQSKSILNRILAFVMCFALVLSYLPGISFAAKAEEAKDTASVVADKDFLSNATCSAGVIQSEVTNGSSAAWKLTPARNAGHNWLYPEFVLDRAYDIQMHKLTFDIMITGATSSNVGIATLDGKWVTAGAWTNLTMGQWETVEIDLSTNDKGVTSISRFSFGLNLASESENYAIYIDNVKLWRDETVDFDWIKLPVDSGSYYTSGTYEVVTGLSVGGSSDQSMKIHTTTTKGAIGFNTDYAVTLGKLEAMPNMTSGTLSAWFYFGHGVAPAASLRLTFKDDGVSNVAPFSFEDKGNGWYFGTVDCSAINKSSGSDMSQVARVNIRELPANTTIYIDGLSFAQNTIDGLSVAYPYNTENPQQNAAVESRFDALTFISAINETESAQMILTPGFDVTSFALTMQDVVNANGNVIPADAFEVFVQKYATVENSRNGGGQRTDSETGVTVWDAEYEGKAGAEGVFPNALIPQAACVAKSENVITSGNNQGIWVNLNVGKDVAPGTYTGFATLTVNGTDLKIPVSVSVWDVALSDEVHVKSSFQIWWDHLAKGEGLSGDVPAATARAYENYLISKRIMPYDFYSTSWSSGSLANKAAEIAENPAISSYAVYANVSNMEAAEADLRADLTALINKNIELAAAGSDADLFAKAYIYLGRMIDEPRSEERYTLVNEVTAMLDGLLTELAPMLDAYPALKTSFLSIKHLVTGPDPLDKTYAFINAQDYGEVAMTGDSYAYCPQYQWLHTEEQRERYADQEQLWWYGCTHPVNPYPGLTINSSLMISRALGWMMYDYDIDGLLYWCVNSWGSYEDDGFHLREDWNTYTGFPGEGVLILPGSDYGITGPIGTIRIENLRESLEDYEYLWLLEQFTGSDAAAATYTAGLYEGAIPATDPAVYHANRVALLGAIEEQNIAANGATVVPSDLPVLPCEPQVDGGDLLYGASLAYDQNLWKEANGLTYGVDTENTYGDTSVQSWGFHVAESVNNNYAAAQMLLSYAHDFTGCSLTFDAKVNVDTTVGLRLHKTSYGNQNDTNVIVNMTAGDWNNYVVNFDRVLLSNADTSDLKLITFYFDFAANTGAERHVYIDNVRLVKNESVASDWIHMTQDTGPYYKNVTTSLAGNMVRAKNSSVSLKVIAPAGESGKFALNTESAADAGVIAERPDFTTGTLGAWFYFGDQEPKASLRVVSSNDKGSIPVAINFVYGGQGWYYGTVDTSKITYYDENKDGAPDGDLVGIKRVWFTGIPAGYTVYIDGITFPNVEEVTPIIREDLSADWTNRADTEDPLISLDESVHYAEGSSQSLKVDASEGEYAAVIDVSDILPDMTAGTLGAWFYFGDAEPAAALSVMDDEGYDSGMHSDGPVPFNFGEGVDGWYYGTVDCASILFDEVDVESGASADAIATLCITIYEGVGYIDCLTLDVPEEDPTTEPPATEPPATEPEVDADPGDLLSKATAADTVGVLGGGNFSYDANATVTYGKDSTKSWMFAGNESAAGWPTALLNLGKGYDMSGKILAFDIKTEGGRGYIAISTLHEAGSWTNVCIKDQFNIAREFNTADWSTVYFDLESILAEGKSLSNIQFIKLGFDFDANAGTERKYYIDNVRLLDRADKGEDLFAKATISCGTLQSEVTNGSETAWKLVPNLSTSHNWVYPSIVLDQAYDLAGYKLVMDVMPVGMTSYRDQISSVDGVGTGIGSTYRKVGQWNTIVYDLSNLSSVSKFGMGMELAGVTEDYAVYIDNVYLFRAETVEEDMINLPVDSGESKAGTYEKVYNFTKDTNSGISLKLIPTADGEAKVSLSGKDADMSTGVLGAWFYFGDQTPAATINFAGKWKRSSTHSFTFGEGVDGWYYGKLDLTTVTFSEAEGSMTQVNLIRIMIPAGYEPVYVDYLTYDPDGATKVTESESDMLYNAILSYNNAHWENKEGVGTGLTFGKEYQNIYGDKSTQSWYYKATADAKLSAVAQMQMTQSYDATGKLLVFDVKFDAPEGTSIDIKARYQNSGWGDINTGDVIKGVAAGDWTTVMYDLTGNIKDGKDLTDVKFITFTFNFASNTGAERAVYIDNVRLVAPETVEQDWIHIGQDPGDYYCNSTTAIIDEKVKAEGSSMAIKVATPADVNGKFTFNTESISPDVSNGAIGAWFYFGDAEPEASVTFTARNWKGSIPVAFTFGEGEDGWYYGSVNTSAIEFYEAENADGIASDLKAIRRITIGLPADSIIYVDGLTYKSYADVAQWGLVLEDDLHAKFHLSVDDSVAATAQIKITVGSSEYIYNVSELTANDAGLYEVSAYVAAAQMTDDILLQVVNGEEVLQSKTYTVRGYADTILADSKYSNYHALIKEMLNYGAAAQTYFGNTANGLANDGVEGVGASEIPETAGKDMSINGNASNISFHGASLVYRDKVAVRFYFNAESVEGLTFTVNGNACKGEWKNGKYMIEVSDIYPEDLDDQITVVVTDAEGNALTVCYGPMNYVVRMSVKGSNELKALLKAMYNYHLAAEQLRPDAA